MATHTVPREECFSSEHVTPTSTADHNTLLPMCRSITIKWLRLSFCRIFNTQTKTLKLSSGFPQALFAGRGWWRALLPSHRTWKQLCSSALVSLGFLHKPKGRKHAEQVKVKGEKKKKTGQKWVFHTELPELPIARHAEDGGSALSRGDRPARRPDRGHCGTHRRGASEGRLSRTERWRPPPSRPGRPLTSAEPARLPHRLRGRGATPR